MPNRMLTPKEFYDEVEADIAKLAVKLPKKDRARFRRLAWMQLCGMFEAPIRGLRRVNQK